MWFNSTGHACFIILESPKISHEMIDSTQNVYMRISFLLSGSVIEVTNFDFGYKNLQANYITPLPYGGYLLAISIIKDNQDTRTILAYVNNGVNREMRRIDIPLEITLTD